MLLTRRTSWDLWSRGAIVRALVVTALALVPLCMTADPARATERCPSGTGEIANIDGWSEVYRNRGVTVCRAIEAFNPELAYLQIIDLSQEARLRLLVEPSEEQPGCVLLGRCDEHFLKGTAGEWWEFAQEHGGIQTERLLSVTNTAFFTDTENRTTSLSLPGRRRGDITNVGEALFGDVAYRALKRALTIREVFIEGEEEEPDVSYSEADIESFRQSYDEEDVYDRFETEAEYVTHKEGIVGFEPLFAFEGEPRLSRRTMLGVVGGRMVYLLSTADAYSLADAQAMIQHAAGGLAETIQLDGGGSTQLYAPRVALLDSSTCALVILDCRKVPEVIAVLRGTPGPGEEWDEREFEEEE